MKKFILILCIFFASLFPTFSQENDSPYEPMTQEQVENWLASISLETLSNFIIRSDYIEHIKPNVIMPPMTYSIIKDDLYVTPVADTKMKIEIDFLKYAVTLDPIVIDDFVKPVKPKIGTYFLIGGICLGVGLISGFVLGFFAFGG